MGTCSRRITAVDQLPMVGSYTLLLVSASCPSVVAASRSEKNVPAGLDAVAVHCNWEHSTLLSDAHTNGMEWMLACDN